MSKFFDNQKGAIQIIPILLIVAAVGLISFLLITSTAGFKDEFFSVIFPKPVSNAAVSNPVTPPLVIRVDSGNISNYTDSQGNVWSKDRPYVVGGSGYVDGSNYTGDRSTISGTSESALYATSRYGTTFGYNFTVPNGHYWVSLKLAEIRSASCTSGARVFNVDAEGVRVVQNNDTYARVGCATLGDRGFDVNVYDGVLNLTFTSVVGFASVNAIEVTQLSDNPTPQPTPGPISVDKTSVNVTLDRNNAVGGLVYGQGFNITSNAADGWQIRYNEPTQGQGFYESSGGTVPGRTSAIRTYINTNKPNGVYTGSAVVQYAVSGRWFDGPTVSYTINLTGQ